MDRATRAKKNVRKEKQWFSKRRALNMIASANKQIDDTPLTTDGIGYLLHGITDRINKVTSFPENTCKDILKGLVYFVANNPPSVAVNLFKKDQATGVNSFDVFACDTASRRNRNWQYVFATIERRITRRRPAWINGNDILPLVIQKAQAMKMGELMANHEIALGAGSWMIAYWIGKLYSVTIYRCQPTDLPGPLKEAYGHFIVWMGEEWEAKVPSLLFQNVKMWEGEELRSLFPFADEFIPDPNATCDGKCGDVDPFETYLGYLVRWLGEDMLLRYVATFKGTVVDYCVKILTDKQKEAMLTQLCIEVDSEGNIVEKKMGKSK